MKLQQIKIKKSTATMQVQNIKRTLQGVTTVGFIHIFNKRKICVETISKKVKKGLRISCTQVRIFKSKTGRKLAILALKAKTKANEIKSRLFNQCWLQVGIFESRIESAKKALKDAKGQLLTSVEYFVLHVNLCKAYLHLRTFKYSLPKYIANLLF